MKSRVRRVLFLAEAVTLAHVARPIALARGLDASRVEAIVACDRRYERFLRDEAFGSVPLDSIDSALFASRLARGSPVYKTDELRGYVRADLALIERWKPDLVVGDFRLSLSVSARLAGVPYATVTNAYWSPYAKDQRLPLPVLLPLTRLLPIAAASALFDLAQPLAMRAHCAPLNTLRRENGLASLGNDLRRVYSDADQVLYADPPALFAMDDLPPTHRFIGPLAWSPPVAKPPWWGDLPARQLPIVYLTLGSSGSPRVLQLALDALAALPVTVLASTAGAAVVRPPSNNVWLADYLPGDEAAAMAQLVVGNGGSMVCHQAAAAGVPVVGLPSNMDQFLNMAGVLRTGAGVMVRVDRADRAAIRAAASHALTDGPMRRQAAQLAVTHEDDGAAAFAHFVDEVVAA